MNIHEKSISDATRALYECDRDSDYPIIERLEVTFRHLRALDASHRQLLEALNGMLVEFNEQLRGVVHDELAVISKARTAIAAAKELT